MLSQQETKFPSWHQLPHQGQKTRHLHTSTLFDHYIITIGGSSHNESINTEEISIFDIFTHQWQKAEIRGFQPKFRYGHTACLYDTNKIIVYGGEVNEETSNEILILTIIQEDGQGFIIQCGKVSEERGDPRRCYHSAEIFGDQMYVFGGVDSKDRASNELWSFDLKELEWTKWPQEGDVPSHRLRHKSVLINNKMFIFGGRNNTESFMRMNDLHSLDLETFHWSEIRCTGTLPSSRNGMSLVEHKGLLFLFGGYTDNEEFSNELFSLNLKNNKWKRIQAKNESPSKRANSTIISYQDGVFIFGGGQDNHELNDLFYLSLPSHQDKRKLRSNSNQMSQLYLSSLYSDVTFIVQDQRIPAHRMLLGTRCEYFADIFSSSSGTENSNNKDIEIKDCNVETFQALLRYIYCEKVDLAEELALNLFVLCKKWEFKELEEECEEFLVDTLEVRNALERAQLANELKAKKLISSLIEFIIDNMNELEKVGDLSQIPPEINVKVMFELKKRVELIK